MLNTDSKVDETILTIYRASTVVLHCMRKYYTYL